MRSRGVVRLVDVAEQAGVTASTASRALSRPEMVNPTTRERVRAAADALGYVPNRIAQTLITGRTATIVLVVPDLTNPVYSIIARVAEATARERGYDTLFADCIGDPEREATIIDAAARFAAGIIICMPQGSYGPDPSRPRVVAVNRRMSGAHTVVLDQATIVETQVSHLVELGHERILYLNGPKQVWATHERRRHTERLAQDLPGLELAEPCPPTFESGRDAVDQLPPDVTAVVAFTDNQAAGVISRAAELGIRVPEDLSVIGSTDVPIAAMLNPPLTTMRAPLGEMGRTAVSLLLDTDEGLRGRRVTETLRSELVVRRSTAPPRPTTGATPRVSP